MIPEVGKQYHTRSGEKAHVVKSISNPSRSLPNTDNDLGLSGHIDGTPVTWDLFGRYDPTGTQHPWDLVAEIKIDL